MRTAESRHKAAIAPLPATPSATEHFPKQKNPTVTREIYINVFTVSVATVTNYTSVKL
jgi:hypothetical protein